MKEHEIKAILSDCLSFQGMEPVYIEKLVDCADDICFDSDEFIFREGQQADKFYLIYEGLVALEMGGQERGPLTIQTIGKGEIVGWSWLFPPYRWHFDARTKQVTRAIVFDARCIRAKCEQDFAFGYDLMKRFAHIVVERLQATRLQLLDVYGSQR